MSFSAGISAFPETPLPQRPKPLAQPQVDGDPMSAVWAAIADKLKAESGLGQQRQNTVEGALHGRHLGMDGQPVKAQDPWGGKALTFQSGASSLSPDALARSQGSTAVNQWNHPDWAHGNTSAPTGPATGPLNSGVTPRAASPFEMPQPLTGPGGNAQTDAADLHQAMSMYAPDGMSPAGTAQRDAMMPQGYGQASVKFVPPKPVAPPPQPGSAFSFGAGMR